MLRRDSKGASSMISDRVQLSEVVPLSTPFSLQIYPTYFCNFNCNYCFRNTKDKNLANRFYYNKSMDFSTFKKAIDSAKEFENKLKTVVFTGGGDPLVHPDIIKMIQYASKSDVTERVELLTNAALLNPKFIDELLANGLTKIRISIQGIDAVRYREVCGVEIDFDNFLSNLNYLFQNKNNTYIYIKIIDSALRCAEEEKKFHEIFDAVADETAIEHLVPLDQKLDYSNVGIISGNNQQTGVSHGTDICSLPFFMLLLYPDGSVSPCCGLNPPIIGNIQKDSLRSIWNGKMHKKFLMQQLNGFESVSLCSKCQTPYYQINPTDYLDNHVPEIMERLKEVL